MSRSRQICTIFIFQILMMTLFFSSPNTASADDFSSRIDLELLLEDGETVNATQDLDRLWVGETTDHLVFLVSFFNDIDLQASVNLTLRDTFGIIYLISASVNNDSYSLSVTEADEMHNITKKAGASVDFQYITKQIFLDTSHNEMGFYVDYADIGGSQEFDMVVFTGYPGVSTSDRLPDATILSFDDVVNVDRTFDMSAALVGNFDVNHPFGTDTGSSTTPTGSSSSSSNGPIISTATTPVGGSNIGIILVVILLFTFPFVLIIGRRAMSSDEDTLPAKKEPEPQRSQMAKKVPEFLQTSEGTDPTVQMKFMEELNREVRMCCYQTARLNETYCYCGRAVADDLRKLFDD